MRFTRLFVTLLLGFLLLAGAAPRAAAQDAPTTSEPPRHVDIGFDVGPFDEGLDDFPVNAVIVTGNAYEGLAVTVEIRGSGGSLLWTGETTFTPPSVRIPVNPPIAVGRIESAGIVQVVPLPDVEAAQFVPPEVSHAMEGGAGGSGQLALSMVLIVALVALLFRSPLPSSTAQRWTR